MQVMKGIFYQLAIVIIIVIIHYEYYCHYRHDAELVGSTACPLVKHHVQNMCFTACIDSPYGLCF